MVRERGVNFSRQYAVSSRQEKKDLASRPTAYGLLPTGSCLPPTAYCLLLTAYCLLNSLPLFAAEEAALAVPKGTAKSAVIASELNAGDVGAGLPRPEQKGAETAPLPTKQVDSSLSPKLEAFKKLEEAKAEAQKEAAARGGKLKGIKLKLMVVNPSKKHKQIYNMKAFLPQEIEPEHIMSKDDLEIAYDADKKAYYVTKQLELDPGTSVVKAVEVEDIWVIPEEELKSLSEEAQMLFDKLGGTSAEGKARLLLDNTIVLLTQIFELQNDETLTPEEHISSYRKNKEKLREIELDLVTMRRLVFDTTGEATGDMGKAGEEAGTAGAGFLAGLKSIPGAEATGAIPAWVAWRVIFIVLIFVGVASSFFYFIWHRQLRLIEKRKREEEAKTKGGKAGVFDDIFSTGAKDEKLTSTHNPDKVSLPFSKTTPPNNFKVAG